VLFSAKPGDDCEFGGIPADKFSLFLAFTSRCFRKMVIGENLDFKGRDIYLEN